MTAAAAPPLSWLGIVRLGLVQAALGAIVVLTNSTLNRVMVVELALPAMLPGALVGLHYALQVLRPRLGHGSDTTGRRTPWIVGGLCVLALGGIGAAAATALMASALWAGIALAVVAFVAIGLGVGAAGTSVLVLIATRTAPHHKGPAATIAWVMMIAGIVLTATIAGRLLDPYSPERLLAVGAGVCVVAVLVAVLAVWGVEGARPPVAARAAVPQPPFRVALAEVWREPQSRRFAVFIMVSMLAYSAQDLILEPYAGLMWGLTVGESTQLSALQNQGVLLGMVIVAFAGRIGAKDPGRALRALTIAGCVLSAAALLALAAGSLAGDGWPFRAAVFALGFGNGAFAVAAIGRMMGLVSEGHASREGTRMGVWGAAQAVAFGVGGFAGTVAADLARWILGDPGLAYGSVFVAEAAMFLVAAWLAARIGVGRAAPSGNTASFATTPQLKGAD